MFFYSLSLPSLQMNCDSAMDDATSNHVDSLQQSQESSSSALSEETTALLNSPALEMACSDSIQLPEV